MQGYNAGRVRNLSVYMVRRRFDLAIPPTAGQRSGLAGLDFSRSRRTSPVMPGAPDGIHRQFIASLHYGGSRMGLDRGILNIGIIRPASQWGHSWISIPTKRSMIWQASSQ